jgi:hypothetical protein
VEDLISAIELLLFNTRGHPMLVTILIVVLVVVLLGQSKSGQNQN